MPLKVGQNVEGGGELAGNVGGVEDQGHADMYMALATKCRTDYLDNLPPEVVRALQATK